MRKNICEHMLGRENIKKPETVGSWEHSRQSVNPSTGSIQWDIRINGLDLSCT